MASDPTIDALRDVLDESLDEIRRWDRWSQRRAAERGARRGETNPIAVIVTHALGSHPLVAQPRDGNAACLRAIATQSSVRSPTLGFAAWTEDMIARCLAVLDTGAWDPARVGRRAWSPRMAEDPRTAAYSAAHALAHLVSTSGTCT